MTCNVVIRILRSKAIIANALQGHLLVGFEEKEAMNTSYTSKVWLQYLDKF